jgi:cytochrome c556
MRKLFVFLGLTLALSGAVLSAQFEISEDDMRTIEDTTKDLDSHVTLKNKKAALVAAQELITYFQQVKGFYAAKPDAADGVGFSHKTVDLAQAVARQVEANQFNDAVGTMQSLTRSCKTCHDVYKSNNN